MSSAPMVEWLSFRIEGSRAPRADEDVLYRKAVSAGMHAMSAVLNGAVEPCELRPTLTVYPLTQCHDVHHALVAALRAIVDRDLTYIDGFVAEGQISSDAIVDGRVALANRGPSSDEYLETAARG